jgi:steroid delta-isomerase-like uncharacterized protein
VASLERIGPGQSGHFYHFVLASPAKGRALVQTVREAKGDLYMSEENKAVVRRELEEIFTQGNLDAAQDVYAPNYYSHQPAGSEDISGLEAIKQFTAGVRQAFPDMQITIEDQVAEGDKVVTRFTSRGTHQGELWGIPPTGKEVEVTSISMDRIEGGKIAEHWTHADQLGMMQQLGVMEQPPG